MKDVLNFLNIKLNLQDESIVVACSGGPDSMALLDILVNIRKNKKINIICAHVNHKLRIESDSEKIDVENYCKQNNIIFEYHEINNYNSGNFHNQARNIRYNFFEEVVNKYNAKYLFTAHHGDDLIETILMRISRGSTINGYSGFRKIIKKKDYYIVKPLIYVTKQQLLEYIEENKIKYAVDHSNEKDVYTRNRYRKYVLPFLKSENSNIHKKYLKFSEQIQEYEDFVDSYITKIIDDIIINNCIKLEILLKQEKIVKERVLMKFLYDIYKDDISLINDNHIKAIFELINSNKGNATINLPKNLIFQKTYNLLKVVNLSSIENTEDYDIILNDELLINNKKIIIVNQCNDTTNYTIRLNSDEIKLPLHIRNIRIGDKMEVKGLNGHKKIKDIYIDSKLTAIERKNYPLLVDDDEKVLWIPGIKKSKYDKSKNEIYDIIVRYI